MSHVTFEVHPDCEIEKSMLRKMADGCNLLSRILRHEEFARWVYKFQWQTNDGQTFNRFYHSRGRSNEQVYQSLMYGVPWDKLSPDMEATTFEVVPCSTVEEFARYSKMAHHICIDQRYLHKPGYTPIHIAAALCQEYSIYLGYPPRGTSLDECWSKFTVPVASARIVRDVAVILARTEQEILRWCMLNDTFQFDYQPCSFTLGMQKLGKDILEKSNEQLLTFNESRQGKHDGNSNILTSLPN